ncbi:HDOD domain-containing protein [Chitiniphilus eburneus]|uniref:HDOD domain-containing protein n=1 Tax=Chitiniphilus eburneus TaxID=2571148 RepID=A0A4V5MQM4_9NEIS|nr:HDOD domain-containing protein [Chitiniphilus eburneus]TJZ73088.1 HDOD domain-containing protein [Chitiniphilus eburneus]
MLHSTLPTYDAWVDKLAACELPVLQYTCARLQDLQSRVDEISIRDIARPIRHDALMTLRVIRFLQMHRHVSQVTDVNTVDRVLMMIGMRGFIREFGQAVTVETRLHNDPKALTNVRRILARASLAAQIAEAMAGMRRDIDPEEVATACLLHDTVEIFLWLIAPRLAAEIETLQAAQPDLRTRDAQREVLGHTLFDLQLALVQRWHLPALLAHLIDERYLAEPRVRTVIVATALSRHLYRGWDNAALPDDYKNVGELLGLEPDAAYALVRDVTLRAGRDWHWYETLPPMALRPRP